MAVSLAISASNLPQMSRNFRYSSSRSAEAGDHLLFLRAVKRHRLQDHGFAAHAGDVVLQHLECAWSSVLGSRHTPLWRYTAPMPFNRRQMATRFFEGSGGIL